MVSDVSRSPSTALLDEQILGVLGERLHEVAGRTVAAVTADVPGYTGTLLSAAMRENIEVAVQMALAGFLKLAAGARDGDPGTPLGPMLEGAYALGRGEAKGGRSMDALLAAYRVGARVAWRDLAGAAAHAGLPSTVMAQFAELLFAYIDELSAASAAGHTDELTVSGRVRERYREQLGQSLLAGADAEVLAASAERAGWEPPSTLTAVLLPGAHARAVLAVLSPDTLQLGEDLPGIDGAGHEQALSLLLVPDADGPGRVHLIRVLDGRHAVVGPARPWVAARSSFDRAARTARLSGVAKELPARSAPVDSDDHLADLVLGADPEALADLRARVLAPLAGLPAPTRQRLAETLLSWLLHQGRREEVAAELHVHAQTVRYRMTQLRELYGDLLADPRAVRELVLALPA